MPEGRSGVASEDQEHRTFPLEAGEADGLFSVDRLQLEVRSLVTDFQRVAESGDLPPPRGPGGPPRTIGLEADPPLGKPRLTVGKQARKEQQ